MDVAASEPAKISYAHAVQKRASPRVLIDHISDRGGTHQEPVVVVMQTGIIFVPCGNELDRKSTRLNSSHPSISYAVFCLKKKKKKKKKIQRHKDKHNTT